MNSNKQLGDIVRLSDGNLAIYQGNDPKRNGCIIVEKRGRDLSTFFSISSIEKWITHRVSKVDLNTTNITFKYRLYFSARKIQRQWHNSINDPKYNLCKMRLIRDFQTINQAAALEYDKIKGLS